VTDLGDLCSGAGLGADGYAAVLGSASIHGFDLFPQPDYPYPFTQADALELLDRPRCDRLLPFAALHTSFPCQIHTTAGHLRTAQGGTSRFVDLLTPGLALLRAHWGDRPWIVENVDDRSGNVRRIMAPRDGETLIMLCGTMFGLPIWRHRLFLTNFPVRRPTPTGTRGVYARQGCRHDLCDPDPITGRPRPWGIYHVPGDSVPSGGRTARDAEHARTLLGVSRALPWDALKEGFPPAYTSWVAADLVRQLHPLQGVLA
jgi:hypothetical protein